MAAVQSIVPGLDVARLRADFPALARRVNGHPLAYLDNAASSQQPAAVIDAVADYARSHHANVHRGVHTLSQEATALFEGARERVRRFINAASVAEIVFVRGTTEAITLVAPSHGRPARCRRTRSSFAARTSNIVPWQILCSQTGAPPGPCVAAPGRRFDVTGAARPRTRLRTAHGRMRSAGAPDRRFRGRRT